MREIRTVGYVLRRTNYAEADRIIDFITPEGKIAAIARGVRKPRSKLAGGVELFTQSELIFHAGRGELMTVTSARMKRYYGEILKDFRKMECAGEILKKVDRLAEGVGAAADYYEIVSESLGALNTGLDTGLVGAYAELNILKTMGEEPNLYRDVEGQKLVAELRYDWDVMEKSFRARTGGRYGAEEIKILRLLMTNGPMVVSKIKGLEERLPEILWFMKLMVK